MNWTKQPTSTGSLQLFCNETECSKEVKELKEKSPLALFNLFFHNELINHIAFQTNLYATQKHQSFVPTSSDEIRCFFGINIFMAMKVLPSYRDYWSTASDFHDEYISSLMTVKRFSFLLNRIHFNDNY